MRPAARPVRCITCRRANAAYLTGRSFFPSLMSRAVRVGPRRGVRLRDRRVPDRRRRLMDARRPLRPRPGAAPLDRGRVARRRAGAPGGGRLTRDTARESLRESDAPALTLPGGRTMATASSLAATLTGTVLTADQPGYDGARAVHNGLDRPPAGAHRRAAGRRRRRRGRRARAPRAGWRSGSAAAGTTSPAGRSSTAALMIDLAEMRGIDVDPEARDGRAPRAARRGPTLNDATRRARPGRHRRRDLHDRVAGLTLGGGLGWLMAKHGLAADNLRRRRAGHRDGRGAAGRRRRRTPTCSGRCAAAAATSASPRR